MKRIGSVVLCCLGVTAIAAGAAVAENSTPNPKQIASQLCTSELHAIGVKQFKMKFGDSAPKYQHAMQNCKGKKGNAGANVVNNAAHQCKAERADANFAATHGGMTFDQFYGTNENDRNAFGKCVSTKAHEAVEQNDANLQNAAHMCRAERGDPNFAATHDGKSFTDFYGTNKNKKNAFGKCVSQKAKAQHTTPPVTV